MMNYTRNSGAALNCIALHWIVIFPGWTDYGYEVYKYLCIYVSFITYVLVLCARGCGVATLATLATLSREMKE